MKTYLFDLDGTLIDSMPTFASTILRILDDHGIVYGSDIIKTVTPLGLAGSAKHLAGMGVPLTQTQLEDLIRDYLLYGYHYEIQPKEHVVAVLRELKARGAGLNVLTASPHVTLDVCLKRLGMWELFDNVWSCDDFGTTKADPEIYQMVARKLDVPVEEILFLDDNYYSCATAKSAGMQVCGVYDPFSEEYIAQMKALTGRYIYDFRELLGK